MPKQYKIFRAEDFYLRKQISEGLNEMVQKDGGNAGGDFPDGQVVTGNLFWFDSAAQRSNPTWIQDRLFAELGGFMVVDYDLDSGVPPAVADIVAVVGMTEDPDQPGVKTAGLFFASPEYSPIVASSYEGNVQFQSLKIPLTDTIEIWQWPTVDGPPGGTLTTDGNGGLYWTDPPNPPNIITDTDTTDFLINPAPAYSLIPVTVTATRDSTPAQVSLDISLYTNNNNQSIDIRMLVDGTPTGQTFSYAMPRNAIVNETMNWTVVLPNGNEVITVETQSFGGQDCFVYGATGQATVLTLLEPSGVQAAYAEGTSYVVSKFDFNSRFLQVEQENLAKLMSNEVIPPGPPPTWADTARGFKILTLLLTSNVNLLDPDIIDEINWLETVNVLAPGRAAVILAP